MTRPPFVARVLHLGRSPTFMYSFYAVLAVVALALELGVLHALVPAENHLADRWVRLHADARAVDPDIVLVDIDDASLADMQDIAGRWQWPREIHADLVEALAEFGARAVVFDITFSERDLQRPASDQRFSDLVQAHPEVYLAAARLDALHDDKAPPLALFAPLFGDTVRRPADTTSQHARAALQIPDAVTRPAMRLGLVNSLTDPDGVLRRYPVSQAIHDWHLPSLPARVVADLKYALPANDTIVLNWPARIHTRFSYGELYRALTEKRPDLTPDQLAALDAMFRNKIIVVGASATGLFDHHLTPMGAGYPGPAILALAIDNLKNGSMLKPASMFFPFFVGMLLIALVAAASLRHAHPFKLGVALLALSVMLLVVSAVALRMGHVLPMLTPLAFAWLWFFGAATHGYLRERRVRERAVGLFGRFLNPDVVRKIVHQGETVESLSGRTRHLTVLFSDIRGFTSLSESRPPQDVVLLLNRYFSRQVEVVFRHGGTLDKFIGDCIMAFWGAPLDDPDHARHAVGAAMEMQEALLQFRAELATEFAERGEDPANLDFDVGIGLHSGPAVVGFIGAQRKLDYTCIGDTVNLASRVEGLTKGVARVLVTYETVLACGAEPAGPDDVTHPPIDPTFPWIFKARGSFAVKGRVAAVELYEPLPHPLASSMSNASDSSQRTT